MVNRGGREEVGDAGVYGDAFLDACCPKAATSLAGQMSSEKLGVRDRA